MTKISFILLLVCLQVLACDSLAQGPGRPDGDDPCPDCSHPCETNCTHTSGCNPDPHYYSWDLSYYDFQGGCDQIAIDNPILQLQIRTRPRNGYSTVTEVGLKFKNTLEIFNLRVDGAGTYTETNSLTALSVLSVVSPPTPSLGGTWDVNIDSDSLIRFNGWSGGMSVQVVGKGNIFSGSEGMFGSWDHGGVRFQNGTLFNTAQGWNSPGAIDLALDWQVGIADSLMNVPNPICDASSACGPAPLAFACTDVRRALNEEVGDYASGKNRRLNVDPTCTATDCNDITVDFLKEACEKDIALTGDTSFACEPSKVNPIIEIPGPNDFVPHPTDSLGDGQGGGDPHFETFNGQAFSYHGECDLVMMHSSSFAAGLGLDLHIRTTRVDLDRISYSYISSAAVGIGNKVLEVKDDGSVLVDGSVFELPSGNSEFAGFPITKTFKGTKKNIHVYNLFLEDDEKSIQIRVNLKTGMVFVDVRGNFLDSVGLMGRAGTTKGFVVARDGETNMLGQWNAYGEEWQVRNNEPKLFAENRAPQHPAGCLYKSQKQTNAYLRRRLLDGTMNTAMTIELASKACENFSGRKKDFCIADVMATGDAELAEDPFYFD